MQKYVIALYIRLSIEDYKYDTSSTWRTRRYAHSSGCIGL